KGWCGSSRWRTRAPFARSRIRQNADQSGARDLLKRVRRELRRWASQQPNGIVAEHVEAIPDTHSAGKDRLRTQAEPGNEDDEDNEDEETPFLATGSKSQKQGGAGASHCPCSSLLLIRVTPRLQSALIRGPC